MGVAFIEYSPQRLIIYTSHPFLQHIFKPLQNGILFSFDGLIIAMKSKAGE